jgi:hypothetical protein
MNQSVIMARHPAIFGKPAPNKYGRCPICDLPLVRKYSGGYDDHYICCPSHQEGHPVYLEGDHL